MRVPTLSIRTLQNDNSWTLRSVIPQLYKMRPDTGI